MSVRVTDEPHSLFSSLVLRHHDNAPVTPATDNDRLFDRVGWRHVTSSEAFSGTLSGLQRENTERSLACTEAARALSRINDVAAEIFRACLALDALQQAAESEYGKSRAAAAAQALDRAVADLRALAVMLSDDEGQ